MKYRPLSLTSSSAPMIYGHPRWLSSIGLHNLLMRRMAELEERLFLLEEALQAVLPVTERRYIISQESAQPNQTQYAMLWSEDTLSSPDLASVLQMFSRECSGPH